MSRYKPRHAKHHALPTKGLVRGEGRAPTLPPPAKPNTFAHEPDQYGEQRFRNGGREPVIR